MFGGGGGLNPRKMKQMMEQMGIEVEELDAEEVVIRTGDGDLVFSDADVTRMDARGQQTYQIVGEPERQEGGGEADDGDAAEADAGGAADAGDDRPFEAGDVDLVVGRTGASEDEAREALTETGGDIAAAIDRLE